MPNSGKACLEATRKQGGKREAIYCQQLNDEHRFKTLATATVTGGKVRPITIASAYQDQYSWLNKFMLDRLRKCKWMIAGRSVAEWAEECVRPLAEGQTFVSGDLKSATTLFSGEFAETVIDLLPECVGLSEDEVDEIKKGLTQSSFYSRDEETGELKYVGEQKRGQNLGADCSFPILCLVSMLVGFETLGKTDELLKMKSKEFRNAILNECGFGVNGDDFVVWGEKGVIGERWVEAVALTSGVPEPSKSPQHGKYFTVNSELWIADDDGVRQIPVVKPHLLLSLCRTHVSPQNNWLVYLMSPIWTKDLGLSQVIFDDVPRVHGGLGADPECSWEWVRRYIFCQLTRSVDVTKALVDESPLGLVHRRGDKTILSSGIEERQSVRVTGLVRKEWLVKYTQRVYALRDLLKWDNPKKVKRMSFDKIRSLIERKTQNRSHLVSRDARFDTTLSPIWYYEEAMAENWMEQEGWIFVHDKPFYEDVEYQTSFPEGSGFLVGKSVESVLL